MGNEIMTAFANAGRQIKNAYYHANLKGTGSAIKFALHPATPDAAGYISCELARQATVYSRDADGNVTMPTFDWANCIKFNLYRDDLSQVLQVLRGMQESIADGKGLFHSSATGQASIRFEHRIEPKPSYHLNVVQKDKNPAGKQDNWWYFIFDVNEAFVLMLAFEQAILPMCFGVRI